MLATNVLLEEEGKEALTDDRLLAEYKGRHTVERGFRFLKDPLFFTSSVFVKSPKRVATVAMVMGLCLLIYALGGEILARGPDRGGGSHPAPERQAYPQADLAMDVPAFSGGAPAESGQSGADLEPHRGTKIYLELPGPELSTILSALLKEGAERES